MELQIIFDRADRLYRFGDELTGRVVLEPDVDRTYHDIWIAYRWRTHGRGNRDDGAGSRLNLLTEKTAVRGGERREFPFHFVAPNGPVSYHGHWLNVDWYLTAHVQSGASGYVTIEQDFLLQPGKSTGAIVLGNREVAPEDVPVRSREEFPLPNDMMGLQTGKPGRSGVEFRAKNLLLGLVIAFTAWLGGAGVRDTFNWNPVVAYVAVLVAIALLVAAVQSLLRNAYRRKLRLGEVWVRPATVYPDGRVRCHVDFVARGNAHLEDISATITALERVTSTAGTGTVTETRTASEKVYTRTFEDDLSEGRWIAFDATLPLDPNAPVTFSSGNNELAWSVRLKAKIRGWPAWQQSFPITVLPDIDSPPNEGPGPEFPGPQALSVGIGQPGTITSRRAARVFRMIFFGSIAAVLILLVLLVIFIFAYPALA